MKTRENWAEEIKRLEGLVSQKFMIDFLDLRPSDNLQKMERSLKMPRPPPPGMMLQCPECSHSATLEDNAYAHVLATGHLPPMLKNITQDNLDKMEDACDARNNTGSSTTSTTPAATTLESGSS